MKKIVHLVARSQVVCGFANGEPLDELPDGCWVGLEQWWETTCIACVLTHIKFAPPEKVVAHPRNEACLCQCCNPDPPPDGHPWPPVVTHDSTPEFLAAIALTYGQTACGLAFFIGQHFPNALELAREMEAYVEECQTWQPVET